MLFKLEQIFNYFESELLTLKFKLLTLCYPEILITEFLFIEILKKFELKNKLIGKISLSSMDTLYLKKV